MQVHPSLHALVLHMPVDRLRPESLWARGTRPDWLYHQAEGPTAVSLSS